MFRSVFSFKSLKSFIISKNMDIQIVQRADIVSNIDKRSKEDEETEIGCSKRKKLQLIDKVSDNKIEEITKENSKVKKRKYALLIGYSGEGYFGLQRLFYDIVLFHFL